MPTDPRQPEGLPPLGELPEWADACRCESCGQPWPCGCPDPTYTVDDPECVSADNDPPPWMGEMESSDA